MNLSSKYRGTSKNGVGSLIRRPVQNLRAVALFLSAVLKYRKTKDGNPSERFLLVCMSFRNNLPLLEAVSYSGNPAGFSSLQFFGTRSQWKNARTCPAGSSGAGKRNGFVADDRLPHFSTDLVSCSSDSCPGYRTKKVWGIHWQGKIESVSMLKYKLQLSFS